MGDCPERWLQKASLHRKPQHMRLRSRPAQNTANTVSRLDPCHGGASTTKNHQSRTSLLKNIPTLLKTDTCQSAWLVRLLRDSCRQEAEKPRPHVIIRGGSRKCLANGSVAFIGWLYGIFNGHVVWLRWRLCKKEAGLGTSGFMLNKLWCGVNRHKRPVAGHKSHHVSKRAYSKLEKHKEPPPTKNNPGILSSLGGGFSYILQPAWRLPLTMGEIVCFSAATTSSFTQMDVFNLALKNPLPPRRDVAGEELPQVEKAETKTENGSDLKSDDKLDDNEKTDNDKSDEGEEYRKRKSSRRKHRNSHLGCGTCKKRRIKCDENLPQCFNCVKGKLHCAYLNLDAPARNALRMAQYNQNLRQDGAKDKKDEKKEVLNVHPNPIPQLPPQPMTAVPVAPSQYPAFVPYHVVPKAEPGPMLPQVLPQQPPPGTTATVIQSPYGPLVLFQPIGLPPAGPAPVGPVAFSPVQVVPPVPVMYQDDRGVAYPGTVSLSNLPPTKNHSFTDIQHAKSYTDLSLPQIFQGMPEPQQPVLSDPARFLSANPVKNEVTSEPVKLPEIQSGTSAVPSTTQSTNASANTSHAPSKVQLASLSSATSPVLQGDKVPSISKLLS